MQVMKPRGQRAKNGGSWRAQVLLNVSNALGAGQRGVMVAAVRALAAANTLPGSHGLWIAAAAPQFEIPLLTRNTAQFARIEGIQLESY